ncbi:MAG: hypothetical protein D6681_19925 [Calditrichaeota bacterium]|nr:MAG: hypothetical protein D6681_19925 [Calditrichota bacterium]
MDMAVELSDRVYIMELKCNQSADEALGQIKAKGYAERYQGRGKEIVLVGINFDTGERRVTEWKTEKLSSRN